MCPSIAASGAGQLSSAILNRLLPRLAALLTALALLAGPAGAAEIVKLASPGLWPGVSHLIAFDNSVWFVNSEPYANVNAADVYRYDPAERSARYQRGLMSQDTGTPTVFGGRLYWPYEDPRSNAMLGEYEVTDGKAWQWHSFTEGSALHVHVMRGCGDRLMAGTGGWEGALQVSADNGRTWREILRLADAHKDVTRIVDIAEFDGRCVFSGSGSSQPGHRVFEIAGGAVRPLPGWPAAQRISALTPFKGALYALNESDSGRAVLRYDGTRATPVTLQTEGLPRDLATNGETLFAVTSDGAGGEVWESRDGMEWTLRQRIEKERPIDILAVGDDIYVGTYSSDGGGALWGPAEAARSEFGATPVELEPHSRTTVSRDTLSAAMRTFDAALAPKSDYTAYRSGILGVVLPLALSRDVDVGLAFTKKTEQSMPEGRVMTFTGHAYSYGDLARWLILHAVGLNGHGEVRREWLSAPWQAEARPSEKYFELTLAAIWAVARTGQGDDRTVARLIERLDSKTDPAWLRGDVVAALTAITGQRYGHDIAAWRAWWDAKRARSGN